MLLITNVVKNKKIKRCIVVGQEQVRYIIQQHQTVQV